MSYCFIDDTITTYNYSFFLSHTISKKWLYLHHEHNIKNIFHYLVPYRASKNSVTCLRAFRESLRVDR